MHDKEAIDMMQRCKQEILSLRKQIDYLEPRAEAYEKISQVLNLLPRQGGAMGEDLVWTLDKRIRETEQILAKPAENSVE